MWRPVRWGPHPQRFFPWPSGVSTLTTFFRDTDRWEVVGGLTAALFETGTNPRAPAVFSTIRVVRWVRHVRRNVEADIRSILHHQIHRPWIGTCGCARHPQGDIEVQTQPAIGTIFHVLMPISGRPIAAPLKPNVAPAVERTGAKVLVVDDEEIVRNIATVTLESAGISGIVGNRRAASAGNASRQR
jgi:hypothetical protein